MTADEAEAQTTKGSVYARAMTLVGGANLLVPVIGLATAPILAHSLGVAGRGEASAALAPNLLIITGATIGLPPALTYVLARRPAVTRVALAWASVFSVLLGLGMVAGIHSLRFVLSQGDAELADLIILGTWLALPTMIVGLLRGAAFGRQMWTAIAVERVLNSVIRLLGLAILALAGALDVYTAVLVMGLAPIVAGIAYVGMLVRGQPSARSDSDAELPGVAWGLLSFGLREWLGSVAIMLIARMSQILVTPLSGVEQLGLLVVAITVSDIPYIVTQAIREVVFGINSAKSDTARLLATSRVATALAAVGSAIIGISMPWWVAIIFGAGFEPSVVPAWLLLLASCLAVPGLIAGAGLDSLGRPAFRSWSMGASLVVNLVGIFLLTPPFGATGAAFAALVGTTLSTVLLVLGASRAFEVRVSQFCWPVREDVDTIRQLIGKSASRMKSRR